MTFNNTTRSLMGIPYSHPEIIQPSTPIPSRPVVEQVDTALAMEETRISEIRRAEYSSFAPVLSPSSPEVQAVSFRNPAIAVDPSDRAETLRRARALRLQQQDAPVSPRSAPLVTSPELVDAAGARGRVGLLDDPPGLLSIVPIQRKQA